MKIRFITTLLTAMLTLSVAQAQEFEFTYKGQTLKYKVTAENEVRVGKLDDNLSGDVIIPSKVTLGKKKYKVTRIRDEAFPGCKNLQSVVIPNSVTSIGVRAFYSCLRLSKIKVSSDNKHYSSKDGVLFNKAGDTLLAVPGGFTAYTVPNSVKHISREAFYGCKNLQSVVIPNSVTSIGYWAFWGCDNLQNVVIPNSVTSIGNEAFWDCVNLQNVVIPNSVTSIGNEAFSGCVNLQSLTIEALTPPRNIRDFFGRVVPSPTIYVPAASVEKYKAAEGWKEFADKIQPIKLSVSQEQEFEFTYEGQTLKYEVTAENEVSVEKLDDNLSGDVIIPSEVTLGKKKYKVTSLGRYSAFGHCKELQSVVIPNSVTSIGGSTFFACPNLQSVVIPNLVTSIGDSTFMGCSNLQNVVIPNSVTSIGNTAFLGCDNLQSVTIEALTPPRIIRDFFWGVVPIPTIYVPAASVEKYKAAEGWKKFADKIQPIKLSVSLGQEFEFTYEGQTLKYKVTAENEVSVGRLDKYLSGDVIIPSEVTLGKQKYKVTRLGWYSAAFKWIQSITIPSSVKSIDRDAFTECVSLSKIEVSKGNKHYSSKGGVLFNKAGDTLLAVPITLTSYTIPNTVKHIGEKAFYACKNLQSVVIPNSVTSIGREAFSACDNLQNLVIPNSVTNIEGGTFVFCSCFRDFNFTYEGVTLRYEIIAENEVWVARRLDWDGCDFSGELKIPSEVEFESKKYKVTRIGEDAFGYCGNLQSVVIPNSRPSGRGLFHISKTYKVW